jgi:hypothetical protein
LNRLLYTMHSGSMVSAIDTEEALTGCEKTTTTGHPLARKLKEDSERWKQERDHSGGKDTVVRTPQGTWGSKLFKRSSTFWSQHRKFNGSAKTHNHDLYGNIHPAPPNTQSQTRTSPHPSQSNSTSLNIRCIKTPRANSSDSSKSVFQTHTLHLTAAFVDHGATFTSDRNWHLARC